jgi:hypothetical protein
MPRAGGHSKLKGLSKSIILHNFRGRHRQTHILKASRQLQRKEAADAGRQAQVQGISSHSYCLHITNAISHRDVERGPPVGGEHDE